jgi:hypothetical protein
MNGSSIGLRGLLVSPWQLQGADRQNLGFRDYFFCEKYGSIKLSKVSFPIEVQRGRIIFSNFQDDVSATSQSGHMLELLQHE